MLIFFVVDEIAGIVDEEAREEGGGDEEDEWD